MKSCKNLEEWQKAELLEDIIAELKDAYVIVEGKKDVSALAMLGIKAHTISSLSKNAPSGNVVILTDLDEEGNRLATVLREQLLHEYSVGKIDTRIRRQLTGLLKIRCIENISTFFKKVESKILLGLEEKNKIRFFENFFSKKSSGEKIWQRHT